MLIVDSNNVSRTTKMLETNDSYYINGLHYDKNTMNPTIFKSFCDNGLANAFCFNQTLAPNFEQKYFTGLRTKNILVDNNNPNICYISNYHKIKENTTYLSGSNKDFQINVFENGKKLYTQTYYENISSYNFGVSFTKWLGQSDTHLYFTIVKSDNYTPTPDGESAPVLTSIIQIPKSFNSFVSSPLIANNLLYTFKKSNGDITVLKETDMAIWIVSELSGHQYEFGKIIKTSNTYQTIRTFNVSVGVDETFYQDITSSGVRVGFKKNSDDEYECYFSGRKTVSDDTYENLIQKAIINTNLETIDIKNITLDEEPYFGHKFGHYYNTITYFENGGKKYLLTSSNVFVNSVTNFTSSDKVISLYEINDASPDAITATLLSSIEAQNMSGKYYGMLFNENLKSFIILTSITSYIVDIDFISNQFKIRNLNLFANAIGIDLNSNYWVIDTSSQVFLFNKETVSEIKIKTPKDLIEYEGSPIPINIEVASINYEGDYFPTRVRLTIDGEATFTDDGTKVKTIETLEGGFKEIGVTISNAGAIRIIPEVIF